MGYLHQVYARLPRAKPYYELYKQFRNNTPGRLPVIGVHGQYLGEKAENILQLLLNTLQYHTTTLPQKNVFLTQNGREQDKLLEIYTVGGEVLNVNWMANNLSAALGNKASFAPSFRLIGPFGECYDPQLADMEMGFTVMDLSTPIPKYCLMFHDLKKPLDAATFANEHLKAMYGWNDDEEENDEYLETQLESERAKVTKLLSELGKFQVLTVAECKEIFPGLYEAQNRDTGRERMSRAVQPSSEPRCDFCNATAKDREMEKLLRCGRCRRVLYCSRECQRGHYKLHKEACRFSNEA